MVTTEWRLRCSAAPLHRLNANAPGATRTRDLQFRKPVLYPTELLGLKTLRAAGGPAIQSAGGTYGGYRPGPFESADLWTK